MKEREYGDYVEDILESIKAIEEFVEGMNFKDFEKDKKTVFAVIRSIEIIGEATKNIPTSIRNNNPKIPWKEMAGMRDKVIHEYFGVDLNVVWNTIKEKISQIKPLMKDMIKNLDKNNNKLKQETK